MWCILDPLELILSLIICDQRKISLRFGDLTTSLKTLMNCLHPPYLSPQALKKMRHTNDEDNKQGCILDAFQHIYYDIYHPFLVAIVCPWAMPYCEQRCNLQPLPFIVVCERSVGHVGRYRCFSSVGDFGSQDCVGCFGECTGVWCLGCFGWSGIVRLCRCFGRFGWVVYLGYHNIMLVVAYPTSLILKQVRVLLSCLGELFMHLSENPRGSLSGIN